MARLSPENIGSLKWAVYDTTTDEILSSGDKTLHIDDISIRPVKELYDKKIELGGHFNFSLADTANDLEKTGFGLSGCRDDEKSFAWDWFVVDKPGHAKKLQESGELAFEMHETPNGAEIGRMEFLTDVSIRISRTSNIDPLKPDWRIKIFSGSFILWPTLVNGEFVNLRA